MFYSKCINVIIDSIGPSIILRSILPSNYIYTWKKVKHHFMFWGNVLKIRICSKLGDTDIFMAYITQRHLGTACIIEICHIKCWVTEYTICHTCKC